MQFCPRPYFFPSLHSLLFVFMLSFCVLRDLHAARKRFWGAVCFPFHVPAAVVGGVHGCGPRWRLALVRDHCRLRRGPAIRVLPIRRWGTCSLPAPLSVPLANQHEQEMIVFIITTHNLQECILVYDALPQAAAHYAKKWHVSQRCKESDWRVKQHSVPTCCGGVAEQHNNSELLTASQWGSLPSLLYNPSLRTPVVMDVGTKKSTVGRLMLKLMFQFAWFSCEHIFLLEWNVSFYPCF